MRQRYKVPIGDVPLVAAARHMGLTAQELLDKLPALVGRGFPAPDPTTGNFDLDAVDAWRRSRNPQLFPSDRLLVGPKALDASSVVANRLARARGG